MDREFANEKYEERILCQYSYSEYCHRYFSLRSSVIYRYAMEYSPMPDNRKAILTGFVNSSLLFFYREWVSGGKKLTLEELLDLSDTLMSGIHSFIV